MPALPWPHTLTVRDGAALNLSLDIRCACCWSQLIPLRMLLATRPALATTTAAAVASRLRCSGRCREKPIRVALVDAHQQACASARSEQGWELVFVEQDVPQTH